MNAKPPVDRGATCKYCGSIGLDWRQSARTGRWYLAYSTGIPHSRDDCNRAKNQRDGALDRVREAEAAAQAKAEQQAKDRPMVEAFLASPKGQQLTSTMRRSLARSVGIELDA